jgi:hypothetical protein
VNALSLMQKEVRAVRSLTPKHCRMGTFSTIKDDRHIPNQGVDFKGIEKNQRMTPESNGGTQKHLIRHGVCHSLWQSNIRNAFWPLVGGFGNPSRKCFRLLLKMVAIARLHIEPTRRFSANDQLTHSLI